MEMEGEDGVFSGFRTADDIFEEFFGGADPDDSCNRV